MITGFEVAVSSLAPVTAAAYCNFWCPTRRAKVREIGIFNSSASTNLVQLQIVRTSARGTQSTTVTPTAAANAQDIADLGPTAVVDTAWSVQPTIAAVPMRMADIAGTVGSSVIWNWQSDGELVVPIAAGIAIWNASGGTTAVVRAYFVWGE
jgi:hypothetical protein